MHNDLMLFYSFYFFAILLILIKTKIIDGQEATIYVRRGDTIELCDNRTTYIYAYEFRSFDDKKNLIVEPSKHERYSNPYRTSLLRITNVIENDSGQYKCPQDDTEWQRLQVYVPVQHVYMTNLHTSSHVHSDQFCTIENNNCLAAIDGQSLDIACAADGFPRPALDISLDKNGITPTIMALASRIQAPAIVTNQFKASVYEVYRILGLTPLDNGRNITCRVDMKQINKKLMLSTTKQLHIEFRPSVVEKSKKIYSGINQTRTINCTVLRANPTYIRYSINGLSPLITRRIYDDKHDFHYTFDITPTSIEHFRPFNVTANNSIGSDACTYELIHGGIPDPITHCNVDTYSSNITITISCTKSYAQGDLDGYGCILFKFNDKSNKNLFEEIARTKSCIFALENSHEPVEFRVGSFNHYGSLPHNIYGYIIRLNEPIITKETPFINRRIIAVIGSIFGGTLLLFCFCCLCGTSCREQTKFPEKNDYYQKKHDTFLQLVPTENEKRVHQNRIVYDIPAHLTNDKHSHTTSPSSSASVYHQQKLKQSNHIKYIDRDSITSSLNSISTRAHTVNNKFYDHPTIDNKYMPSSSTNKVIPTIKKLEKNEEEEGNESPVYSTTTDVFSESGSFLVPLSPSKRNAPPPLKPRYSTLSSVRLPHENIDQTSLPLPKPRSCSNSRTRLNNPNSDNSLRLYEERPVSSTDSGIGQSDIVGLLNGDTMRTGLAKSRQNSLQKHYVNQSGLEQQTRYQTLASPIIRGTEC
ncbi:unnamed protein product [Rotaria socialis]|uniref:Ig-like domain-containing protein n=2 Tax=Rotaria socialis TaxID=392032 RepID=A0A818PUX7_9BILA|nr:unnamed protein product [Rotaria socialis]CAF4475648.1 unnamed protein product [Rotaria socialis]